MKKMYFFLLCLSTLFLRAQKKTFTYIFSLQTNEFSSVYSLDTENEFTIWQEIEKMRMTESYDSNINFIEDPNYIFNHVYKNNNDSLMLSNQKILGKNYYISEKIKDFDWKVANGSENILGYNCQIATTNYKGRNYTAYFTTEIKNNLGPWKFGGLPGMILKISSNDFNENYQLECIEIKKSEPINFKKSYKKFLKKNKFVSWNQFLKDIDSHIDRYIKFKKSQESDDDSGNGYYTFKLSNYLEIFHKEAQVEGIMY